MIHNRTTRETFLLKADEFLDKLGIKPLAPALETFVYYDGKKIGPIDGKGSITIETHSVENAIGAATEATDG